MNSNIPSSMLLHDVQSNSAKRGMRQHGAMPFVVTLFMPASLTRTKPSAAPNKALKPESVKCQHQERSISRSCGSGADAKAEAARSAKCSHSATFSKRHCAPSPPVTTAPSMCMVPTSAETQTSAGGDNAVTCALNHAARCAVKNAAQSASAGCDAFRNVNESMLPSMARPCNVTASNSLAKETVRRRSPTKVPAMRDNCCASRSSPSRLNSCNLAQASGVGTRNIWATLRRKHPSNCNACQARGLLENTAMLVKASQKRRSRRQREGHRRHKSSMCWSSKLAMHSAPNSSNVGMLPHDGSAAPEICGQPPTSSMRSGPLENNSAMPVMSVSSTVSSPRKTSRSRTPRP
mmetsp:Transcript_111616/g.322616  ORF Transcript_111616/g.322616 Transcript_111616/m.322616 type:complete len:349 (+) Transcript_111616:282-1328(+)